MRPDNIDIVNKSFEIQIDDFESNRHSFTDEEYLEYTICQVAPCETDSMLEVAAGTCVCGRAFAPLVQRVVCLDATTAMLQVGKSAAEEAGITNIEFVRGYGEELPFPDESFDIVFSRLAFHHIPDPEIVFAEMSRGLKMGGKLVLIDLECANEVVRTFEDEIETMRDPSHVKILSRQEMSDLFVRNGYTIEVSESRDMEQNLTNWLDLTKTPEEIRRQINSYMMADIESVSKTGFSTYYKHGEICFTHRWLMTIGRKIK